MNILSTAYCLGERKVKLVDKYNNIEKLVAKTGISEVWETDHNILTLAEIACKSALKGFDKSNIKILILVTQSPLDLLPANSITLSNNLGLGNDIFTFDFNQGCSGFVQSF